MGTTPHEPHMLLKRPQRLADPSKPLLSCVGALDSRLSQLLFESGALSLTLLELLLPFRQRLLDLSLLLNLLSCCVNCVFGIALGRLELGERCLTEFIK